MFEYPEDSAVNVVEEQGVFGGAQSTAGWPDVVVGGAQVAHFFEFRFGDAEYLGKFFSLQKEFGEFSSRINEVG